MKFFSSKILYLNLKQLEKCKLLDLKFGGGNMKFMKGVMIGGLITTGLIMMYTENDMMNKKKIMKKGKQIAKKMGM